MGCNCGKKTIKTGSTKSMPKPTTGSSTGVKAIRKKNGKIVIKVSG